MPAESELCSKLSPRAADLYDHVTQNYPLWSDEKSIIDAGP